MNTPLREAREDACLTQVQVADKVGIAETSYQRLEYGFARPSIVTATKIARILNRPIEDIFPVLDGEYI